MSRPCYPGAVEHAWSNGSYRMEVWMTGATARALLFLHDKDLLVIGEADGTVRVLYEKTRGPTTVVKAHTGSVTALVSVRTSAQKNLFVSAGMDRVIRLWVPDIEKDGYFRVLQELRISPGDEHGDGDDTENEELISLPKVRRSALAPAAATTGDALFCMCDGRRVLVWGPPEDGDAEDRVAVLDVVEMKNTPALMKLFDLRGHSGGVKFVESDGDDEILTIDVLDTLRVFSLRSRSLEATVKRERDTPAVSCALCIREHSQRMTTPLLLLGREDGSLDVRAWPTAGGARMHLLRRHSGRVTHMQHVGELVISAGLDTELPAGGRECVRFSNIGANARTLGSFTTAPVTCMCLRSDLRLGMLRLTGRASAFVLTGHVDGKTILWDVEAQRSLHILEGHHKAVRAVSANRLCAVSGADDSTCRVWRFVDDFVLRKEEEELARGKRQAKDKAEDAAKAYRRRDWEQAYRRRDWEQAVALYSAAIELDREDLLHVTNRAAVHLEAGDPVACIVDCNLALDALALKDEGDRGTLTLGALHDVQAIDASKFSGEEGDSERSGKGGGEVTGDRKVLARAHARKGAALAKLGEEEEAILHLQASLAADPSQNTVRQRLQALQTLTHTDDNRGQPICQAAAESPGGGMRGEGEDGGMSRREGGHGSAEASGQDAGGGSGGGKLEGGGLSRSGGGGGGGSGD